MKNLESKATDIEARLEAKAAERKRISDAVEKDIKERVMEKYQPQPYKSNV